MKSRVNQTATLAPKTLFSLGFLEFLKICKLPSTGIGTFPEISAVLDAVFINGHNNISAGKLSVTTYHANFVHF